MQEPTIYRAPVVALDPEAAATGDEQTGYSQGGYSAFQSTTVADDATTEKDYHDFFIPEERKLGTFSTTLLIVNRVIGTGIYSTPSTIIAKTDSVGATLLFWVLGGIMTFALFVYLEFGTALPRSGGEKVYLERAFQKPRYLATCIFAVQFVLFAVSTGGSISFASYILKAATGDSHDGSWLNRGIAVAAFSVVCLIHAFAPRPGIWISNFLGCFKLVMLVLVVFTGFAALSGRMVVPSPGNFSTFHGPGTANPDGNASASSEAANYATALLQVLYAYSGWENANYVLTEVRDAPKTLRGAAPLAVSTVTTLYVLANIAYFAAISKSELASSKVVVAAQFFQNVWGESVFVTKVLPAFIALSSLGNVFAQSFAMPRVKQELAKEGLLPFSRFFASDWPLNAPTGAIFLHWLFSVILILGSLTSDTYTFVTNLFIYTSNWIKVLLGIGLLLLTFKPSLGWREQRTSFRSYPLLTVFWLVCLLFVLAAPFIPNNLLASIPYYIVPTLGTGMLAVGVLYWLVWAKLLPLLGFHIQHEIIQLPDGSERVKYVHVAPKLRRRRTRNTYQ